MPGAQVDVDVALGMAHGVAMPSSCPSPPLRGTGVWLLCGGGLPGHGGDDDNPVTCLSCDDFVNSGPVERRQAGCRSWRCVICRYHGARARRTVRSVAARSGCAYHRTATGRPQDGDGLAGHHERHAALHCPLQAALRLAGAPRTSARTQARRAGTGAADAGTRHGMPVRAVRRSGRSFPRRTAGPRRGCGASATLRCGRRRQGRRTRGPAGP